MAEIKIAELNLDVSALIKSTADVKKALDELKKSQKELTNSSEDNSEQIVENAAKIKLLSSEYNAGVKTLAEYSKSISDQEMRTETLNLALQTEVTNINQAREANKLLTKLRNEATTSLGEQSDEVKQLNAKIDENNAFIKSNADAYLQQKINIGNYSESIKEALGNLNPLNGGMGDFFQRAQEAGGVGSLLKTSLGAASQGFIGLTKASLSFILTPVGAVITAIVAAVVLIVSAFKSFTPLIDKVEQGMAALSAVFNVVKNTVIALVTGTKSLGEAFSSLGGDMSRAAEDAAKLKKAQQDLEDALASQEVQSAKNRAEINRLNIQAKDRTKSEEERLALLQKAEKIEQSDFEQRKRNSDEALRQVQEEIRISASLTETEFNELKKRGVAYKEYTETKASGQDELFDKLKDALLKETEIQNEFYSNQEKNINKQNKLIEDAEAKAEKLRAEAEKRREEAEKRRQKILDDALSKSQVELALFLSQQGIKAKSLEDELKLAEQIFQKQLEINQKEFDASEKTATDKLKLETENNNARNELLSQQTNLVISNAQRELDAFTQANKSKIDANKFLTEELVAEEKARNERIAQEQKNFAALQLENGVINKLAYDAAIQAIDDEKKLKEDELKAAEEQARIEKEQIDLENRIAVNERDLGLLVQQLELKRQAEVKAAEKNGADVKFINAKYAKAEKDMRMAVELDKVNTIASGLAQAKSLFKENTVAYKALAVAEATMNTYAAAARALKDYQYPIGGIFAGLAIAQGLLNVSKIVGVKFEKGGIQEVGGKRHSAGGTKFYGEDGTMFEAEKGEGIGVLNRGAFSKFMEFNNAFGSGGVSTPSFMAGGGIITQGVQQRGVDTNELLGVTLQAISTLPSPVVIVEDINTGQNNLAQVVNGANF